MAPEVGQPAGGAAPPSDNLHRKRFNEQYQITDNSTDAVSAAVLGTYLNNTKAVRAPQLL